MDDRVAVIIVSHNSGSVLPYCFKALRQQTVSPDLIFLVDSGSEDCTYLDNYRKTKNITVLEEGNIGFAQANNKAFALCSETCDFVFFLNPDAFPADDFIEQAVAFMKKNPRVGILSGKILWFDMDNNRKTNRFDSTGIKRSWYGRWYDRGQGLVDQGQFDKHEDVTALCGAALFCRSASLMEYPFAFDPDFFLYKEDIDLSIRVQKKGWYIKYIPGIVAYHSRGWIKQRRNMPFSLRLQAAKSEILLYKKHPSPYMIWAILKFLLVRIFHI
jgi:GT2 family glycosyltransferase